MAAQELIGRLERKWSATEAGSEVYVLNRSQGTFKPVGEETQELLSFALKMAKETSGAFNPLLYPAVKAWGFTTKEYRIPGEEELKELLNHTDYRNVISRHGTASLEERVEIALGAVAKGYAGDLAVEEMKRRGMPVYVFQPWRQRLFRDAGRDTQAGAGGRCVGRVYREPR